MLAQNIDNSKLAVPRPEKNSLWLLSLYKQSRTSIKYLQLFQQACLNGFWLGILSPDALYRIDELYYSEQQKYITDKYNLSGLSKWEANVIGSYFQEREKLLLLSAGGGREVHGLEKTGFLVDAYECHPGLTHYANALLERENLTSRVRLIERDESPDNNTIYDGAIIGWGGYMLVQGRGRRISLLRKIRKQLKPGKPILLSFFARAENEKRLVLTSKIANLFRLVRQCELSEVGDDLVPNYVHIFTKDEVNRELSEAGLKPVFYENKPYGHAVGIA